MTRQIPAERTLPDKQRILEQVLADADEKRRRKTWLLPVAAAASVAVVVGGALTVPSMLKDNSSGVASQSQGGTTKPSTSGQQGGPSVSIDRGKLTEAQAMAFATECIKWVGSKDVPGQTYETAPLDWPGMGAKVDRILHATKVADYDSSTDWTVAVQSGGRTYSCVGTITKKWPDGRTLRNYDFHTFSQRHPEGSGGGAGGSIGNLDGKAVVTLLSSQWIVVRPGVTEVQQRIVLKGKPTPWFTTVVADGLAYPRAWGKARLTLGDKVRYETRQLDKDGNQVGAVAVDRTVVTKGPGKGSPNMLDFER